MEEGIYLITLKRMINKYDLHVVEWGEFKVSDFFDVENTTPYHWNNLKKAHNNSGVPYITRTASNNGFEDSIEWNFSANKQNTISFWAESATFFYQPYKYVVWNKMYKLSRIWLNRYSLLFLVQVFQKSIIGAGFWYGKWLTGTRFKWRYILLPKDKSWNPDWDFMEGYMRVKENQQFETTLRYYKKKLWDKNVREMSLENCEWRDFEIEDKVGEVISGIDIYEKERTIWDRPYVSATAQNNGIWYFVWNLNGSIEQNCLSVNRNGSVGYSFFHEYEALFWNDTRKLKLYHQNKYVWYFVSSMITKQKEKYWYWYKLWTARLKKQKILLPANSKWEPDWEFIEQYMQYQEQQLVKKYINFAENRRILS